MNPELQKWLRQAQRALAAGADTAAVNRRISDLTGGRFTDLSGLQQAAALDSAAGESEPMQAESGGNRFTRRRSIREGLTEARDILRMGAQGATFGFGDEIAGVIAAAIPGGKGYREARDASRENLARIRGEMPEAAFLGEVAGGFAVPGAGTVGAARTGATAARSIGRAAAAGAASGALYGAGESDELEDVAGDALAGGLLGGFLGGAGTAGVRGVQGARRFLRDPLRGTAGEAGEAVASRLRSAAGLETAQTAPVRQAAQRRARAHFSNLDEMTELDHPGLRAALSNERAARAAGVPREVVEGTRAPTFQEAQKAHQRLRKLRQQAERAGNMDSINELSQLEDGVFRALDDATQGEYGAALPGYAAEQQAVRAVKDGFRFSGRRAPADEAEAAYAALRNNPQAAQAFRESLAAGLVQQVESGGARTFGRIASTPQYRRKLAIVFDGDTRAMESFIDDVSRANPDSRAKALASLKDIAIKGLVGGGAAGVGYGAASLFFD